MYRDPQRRIPQEPGSWISPGPKGPLAYGVLGWIMDIGIRHTIQHMSILGTPEDISSMGIAYYR